MGRQKRRTVKKGTKKYKYSRRNNTLRKKSRKKYSRRKKSRTYRKQSGGAAEGGFGNMLKSLKDQAAIAAVNYAGQNLPGPAVDIVQKGINILPQDNSVKADSFRALAEQAVAKIGNLPKTSPPPDDRPPEPAKGESASASAPAASPEPSAPAPDTSTEPSDPAPDTSTEPSTAPPAVPPVEPTSEPSAPPVEQTSETSTAPPVEPNNQELLERMDTMQQQMNKDKKKETAKLAGVAGLTTLAQNPVAAAAAAGKAAAVVAPVVTNPLALAAAGTAAAAGAAVLGKRIVGSAWDVRKYKKLISSITECLTTLVAYAVINEKTKKRLLAQFKENAGPKKTYMGDITYKSGTRKKQIQANKEFETELEKKKEKIKENDNIKFINSEESQSGPEKPVPATSTP